MMILMVRDERVVKMLNVFHCGNGDQKFVAIAARWSSRRVTIKRYAMGHLFASFALAFASAKGLSSAAAAHPQRHGTTQLSCLHPPE